MTYEEIVSKTKELAAGADLSGHTEHLAVEVNITGEGEGKFYIELKDEKLAVEPYEYYDRDCKLILTAENFFKICDGSLNAVAAYTIGKLKIEGSVDKALEFSKLIDKLRKSGENEKSKKRKK